MRAKPENRILAEKLRVEQGLSYNEISSLTGTSKSTLSGWLKGLLLTEEQRLKLQEKMEANRSTFAQRAWLVNRERHEKAHTIAVQAGINVVNELPKHRSIDELSLAMLYLGEGSKGYGRVQIASTQANILLYFLAMLKKLYQINETRLSFRLNMVNAAKPHEEEYILWWKTELRSPHARFLRTQYDPRSRVTKITNGYHGVCTLTYYSTALQQRLINLANAYISRSSDG